MQSGEPQPQEKGGGEKDMKWQDVQLFLELSLLLSLPFSQLLFLLFYYRFLVMPPLTQWPPS